MIRWAVLVVLLVLLAAAWVFVAERSRDSLVVYCAHDLEFSQGICEEFSRRTGIKIALVTDTEATKSLGLVQRLLAEQDHPRCDVFWNNELLGTVQLAEAGILEPYQGPGYQRIPERYQGPDARWTGFAGRLRVWIVNRDQMPATEAAVQARFAGQDLSKMAVALPMFGTTLTHFSILWGDWGEDRFKAWHQRLKDRGCRFVQGNATVKNLVAEGICDFGWTDTDDYFVGRDDGFPVETLPIRIDGQTICIPNTVAILRGTQRLAEAQRFVEFLLSKEIELQQARSASRQIPLGPVDEAELPEDVRPLAAWARDSVKLQQYSRARSACLNWLQQEYAP